MSASEDYLDQLLNGMSEENEDTPSTGGSADTMSDDDFLRELEDGLPEDSDDFLRDFEAELSGEGDELDLSEVEGEDDGLFVSEFDALVNQTRAEADDSFETMQPTSSRVSDENFNLGGDPEESKNESAAEEISAPDSIPDDILNLLENVEDGPKEESAGGGATHEGPEASADELDDMPIEAYEGDGTEEIDPEELDNPEHQKKREDEAAEEAVPEGEDADAEAPDMEAIAAAAAAESGIQDESALEEGGEGSDEDLLSLLNGIDDGADLSDIGNLLNQDAAGVQELTPEEIDRLQDEIKDITPEEDEEGEEREKLEGKFHTRKKWKKEKRKTGNRGGGSGDEKEKKAKGPGFLAKLLALLFAEADDAIDESAAAAAASAGAEVGEDIDDENLAILRELDAAGEGDNGPAPAEDKKKKKKEKKEKPKKEKPKKEPKPKKPPKPKKEKKPKEKDTSPPLPKAPLIVIAIFAVSLLLLILLFVKLFGSAGSVSDARTYYEGGNYVEAYRELNGMALEGDDAELYLKAQILGAIQQKYRDYERMYQLGKYDMALDCLIRGIGRCYNYEEAAETYLITDAVVVLRDQIASELASVFGVSLDEAKEIYALDRDDYSVRIHEILDRLGLSVSEED